MFWGCGDGCDYLFFVAVDVEVDVEYSAPVSSGAFKVVNIQRAFSGMELRVDCRLGTIDHFLGTLMYRPLQRLFAIYESSAFGWRLSFRSLLAFLVDHGTASDVQVVPDSRVWNRGSRIL